MSIDNTYRAYITEAMIALGDSWDNVEVCTLSNYELNETVEDEYDMVSEARPFYVWTNDFVYFLHCSNLQLNVLAVPRNPTQNKVDLVNDGYTIECY